MTVKTEVMHRVCFPRTRLFTS